MVKTRHRGELENECFDGFVSVPRRQTRTRRAVEWKGNGLESDTEEEEVTPPINRRKSVRSTRRSTSCKMEPDADGENEVEREEEEEDEEPQPEGRRKRHIYRRNYDENDEDSEVETGYRRPTRRSAANVSHEENNNSMMATRSRHATESENGTDDSDSDHPEPMIRSPRFKSSPHIRSTRSADRPRKQYPLRQTVESDEEGDDEYKKDEEPHYLRGRGRQGGRLRRAPNDLHLNGELDDQSIRRSTRQRKLLYGTFNQSLIEKHVMLCGEEGEEEESVQESRALRKRKRYDVGPSEPEDDGLDMYSRVKRTRRQVKRDMYGMPVNEEEQHEETEDSSDEEEEGEGEEEEEEEEQQNQQSSRQYYLRQHKPRTNLYEAPPIEPQRPRSRNIFRSETPPRTFKRLQSYRSPAHRSPKFRNKKKPEPKKTPKPRKVAKAEVKKPTPPPRRRPAFHGNSSTSSSSSDDSDNERRFERRKAKSMIRNRGRCLPMNFLPEDIQSGVKRDRVKIGSSLADVDPMNVDKSVLFDKIGGLGKHIRALKEMIVFPLLYPEIFERFKIAPPRGVLFYGPPGTGKTLLARALANECSTGDRKVAFFMRKGADCLSKWVGESERQLRLLFDQAYQMRPSIIFFDEIDGLAPVRSSRQDQIHSSIVSTLLALMDGLDNRGEIVVIGATNRLDSIDPALRRPGRFDREFLFPLPNVEARSQILEIQTREWNPRPCQVFLNELAEKCVGYCGADLKALCTEGALHALRRRYPQIYTSEDKLELDVSSIEVSARDFHKAIQNIVPASQRSAISPARCLDHIVKPLLEATFKKAIELVVRLFPSDLMNSNSLDAAVSPKDSGDSNNSGQQDIELYSDNDDDDAPAIYEATGRNGRKKRSNGGGGDCVNKPFLHFTLSASQRPMTYRPRLLFSGESGQGQSTHLGPAVLHHLERIPVHVLDLPVLYGVSSRTPEEACAQVFREARRTSPSIIYMPHIGDWWDVIHSTLQATFLTMLQDIQPDLPILLIATSETRYQHLPIQVQSLFCDHETITMKNPSEEERRDFFQDLILEQTKQPPRTRKQAAARVLEVLPKAKAPEPRELTDVEKKIVQKQEEKHLRELRIFLRDILNKLGRDRKFGIFAKPVDTEDVPDYYEIIRNPMDMSTMMSKIDLCQYLTVKDFVADINLICINALEYNPDRDPAGRAIRHRACALRDTCNALIEEELDPDFEKMCEEVKAAQTRRGDTPSKNIPQYYYTHPLRPPGMASLNALPGNYPSRFSRRTRGMEAEEDNNLEGNHKNNQLNTSEVNPVENNGPRIRAIVKRVKLPRSKSQKHKSPWCRTRGKRYKKVIVYVDDYGNEVDPPNKEKTVKAEEISEMTDKNKTVGDKMQDDSEQEKEKAVETDDTLTLEEGDAASPKVEEVPIEGSEEKENKPVVPPGSPPSQQTSPSSGTSTAPAALRSSTRTSRSASLSTHTGILTRSTSPRSTSPRGSANLARQLEGTPHRPVIETTIPKTSLKIGEAIQKTPSPRTKVRRPSTRSSHSDAESMEISPLLKTETSQCSTPASNPAPCPNSPKTSKSPSSQTTPMSLQASSKTSPPNLSSTSMATEKPPSENSPKVNPATEGSSPTTQENEPKEEKEAENKTPSPQVRITRSRTQIPAAVAAMAKRVLETEAPRKVIIEEDTLRQLLASVVCRTHGYNVENLEKLYSHISQAIYYHREQLDKEQLVEDMEEIISNLPVIQR